MPVSLSTTTSRSVQIRKTKNFRHAQLNATNEGTNGSRRFTGVEKDSSKKDGHIFSKPYALCKLANFLFGMHRENGKWAGTKALPLILMAERPETDTYVVVGYNCPERHGDLSAKNKFGRFFLEAATVVQAQLQAERFDANVVEIRRENLQNFFEQLNQVIGA